jgi:hypothetical protein
MEEWQEGLLELIKNSLFEGAISRAKEIARETGMYDEVARFLIGAGAGVSNRDGSSATLLIEEAEKMAKSPEVKNLARRALSVIQS